MVIQQRQGHHRLRTGRISQAHGIYLVTAATWQRHPHFLNWDYAVAAVNAFTSPQLLKENKLLSWVLMPDHVHWLLQLGHSADLSVVIGAMKSGSARAVGKAGCSERVWATAFHDHGVRQEEDIRALARYIVANPIRAGLVASAGDYPFWDAVWV